MIANLIDICGDFSCV